MICGKARFMTHRTSFVLSTAILFAFVFGTATKANAQKPSPLDNVTVKFLIGDAVSLSNRDYPEVEKAIQRFRNNDGTGAYEFLEAAKKKYPKLPPAQVIFARMNSVIGNAQARRIVQFWLERAVTEVPDDPEAYLILADRSYNGGQIAAAQALFEFAAPLVEKFEVNTKRKGKFQIRILAGRAAVAQRRAKWEKAAQWLNQWIKIDPESPMAHQRLGGTLFQLDKHQEALGEFTKARELDTGNQVSHPYVSLGQLLSQAGDIEKARKAYERAYNEDKADEKVTQAYVDWLISQDELAQAQAIVKTLREQKPTAETILMLDGILDVMQGKRSEAINTMSAILGLDPSNSRATDLLAQLLIESDDVDDQKKALRHAQVNAERFPDNSQVNVTQGWVLYRLGRKSEAQKYISRVNRNQLTSDAYFLLSKMMVENGKEDQAIKAIEALLQKKSGPFIFRREAEKYLAKLKAG